MKKRIIRGTIIALALAIGITGALPCEASAQSAVNGMKAPTVSAELKTTSKVMIKWTKVSGAKGYRIYEYTSASKKWTRKKTIKSASTKSWIRTGITSKNRTYKYKVVPYKVVNGENLNGAAAQTSIYVPKVLKTSTKTYKKTYQYKVIKKARTKLGKKYVWGASGPNSFDCSGFTYWTLKKAGVSGAKIKRYSSQGIYNAYKKYKITRSLSKAQPGDIILLGRSKSTKRIYHAGIYYGNGKYINATTNGKNCVKISKVPKSKVAAIIRVKGLR